MGDLPAGRLAVGQQVFFHTGIVFFFGPLSVKVNRATAKHYGLCMTTRAIHLEMAHSLSTASCLYAVNRFLINYAFSTQVVY